MTYWTKNDFDTFKVEGLTERMQALQTRVQPKFFELGDYFKDFFSSHGKGEFYPHVARHARRTKNPPSDSWVAFAPSKRGYKALPHFQIGLWESHLFIVLAVIYENPHKKAIAGRLKNEMDLLLELDDDFLISGDHMKPEAENMKEIGEAGIEKLLTRLEDVKSAELLIGKHLSKEDASKLRKEDFFAFAEATFEDLLDVYDRVIQN